MFPLWPWKASVWSLSTQMDGKAGGRMGFTSDLAWVDMGEWIRTHLWSKV